MSSKNHTLTWGSHVFLEKKSLNSSREEIFAFMDRMTNIINSEVLLPALASIFFMAERLQKKYSVLEKKTPWRTQCTHIAKKPLRDNMITLCREKYQTVKAFLILKEDIITLSSLEAHSKVCIFQLILLLLFKWMLLTILQRSRSCLYLLNASNAFLKEQSNKTFGAELYHDTKRVWGNLAIPSWSCTLGSYSSKNLKLTNGWSLL